MSLLAYSRFFRPLRAELPPRCKAPYNFELAANKTRPALVSSARMFPYHRRCIKMPDLIQEDDSCFGEVTRFRACTLAAFAMAFIVTAAIVGLAWRRWRSPVSHWLSLRRARRAFHRAKKPR